MGKTKEVVPYETADFHIRIEEREELLGSSPTPIYRVINKVTGVSEYEDYLLSRVIETMLGMQELLNSVRDKYNNTANLLTLVGGPDDKPVH